MLKIEEKIQKKSLGLYLLLKTFKRVCAKDTEYIDLHLRMHQRPDILMLNYNRTKIPDGTITYLIREAGQGLGFFAEMKTLLCKLIYADCLGLKPSVYFGEDYLYYDKEYSKKTDNAYEYYFEPIGNRDNGENAGCFTIANDFQGGYVETIYHSLGYDVPNGLEKEFVRMIRKYVHLRKEIEEDFRLSYEKMIPEGKVLGIHYRGTDYKVGYNVHPVQVQLQQVEEKVRAQIESNHFQYVFVATDDMEAIKYLKKKFGKIILHFEDVVRSDGIVSVAFSENERKYHHYKLGFEVLRDMYVLSMCDGLIGGLSQVSLFAQLFKKSRDEEFEYLDIINNGIYSNGVTFSKEQ